MSQGMFTRLDHRAVVTIGGEDRRPFLQGLVSNDVTRLAADRALFAAMLTPQGKFLFDLYLAEAADGSILIDTEADRAEALVRKLTMHRLRARVTIALATEQSVFAVWGAGATAALGLDGGAGRARPFGDGVAFVDPRLDRAGARVIAPAGAGTALAQAGLVAADIAGWDEARLRLGLPDGARDLEIEKALLLENGYEELNGVDFEKGCYMGQELTARTRYRGLIRKRLMPVTIEGPAPAFGTPIRLGDSEAGEMRSSRGTVGLALIRLEAFAASGGRGLRAGEAVLSAIRPDWARFPEAAG